MCVTELRSDVSGNGVGLLDAKPLDETYLFHASTYEMSSANFRPFCWDSNLLINYTITKKHTQRIVFTLKSSSYKITLQ